MRIEIFAFKAGENGPELDESKPVATVTTTERGGVLDIVDQERAAILRRLFEQPLLVLSGGPVQTQEGEVLADTAGTHSAWSPEALEELIRYKLPGHGLAARIVGH